MKHYLTFLFCLTAIALSAQSTHYVVNKTEEGTEEYYVLDSDPSIKHGYYTKTGSKANLLQEGFYYLGKKDSVWKYYFSNQTIFRIANYKNGMLNGQFTEYTSSIAIRATGNYVNDQFSGVWLINDDKGGFEQEYDFTNDTLLRLGRQNYFDSRFNYNDSCHDYRPLTYKGGYWAFMKIFNEQISYPEEEKANSISGTVTTRINIKANGECSVQVVKSLSPNFDKEALRSMQNTIGNWLPASQCGINGGVTLTIPINFRAQ